jgi:acetyl-CoA acetyltransferase
VPLSTTGVLYVYTAVTKAPPGYTGAVPYGLGVVELPEGLRVVTRLTETDPRRLSVGMPMRFVTEPVFVDDEGRQVWSYAFAPDTTDGPGRPQASRAGGGRSLPELPPVVSAVLPNRGRKVDVVGAGIHPFGRFGEKSAVEIGQVAVRAALADAGIGRGDFQAAFCGTVYAGCAAGHRVLDGLGLTGIPIVNVEAGCASSGAALNLAAAAIADGRYDRVLVFGLEKMPSGIIDSTFFEPWRKQAGLAATPAYFGLRARRLMRASGVTVEHLAQVSVKNHRNGVHNPNAMFRKELALEDVLGSPMVCDPLTLYMMCSPNEGAAAVVLEAARPQAGRGSRVGIAASVLTSHHPGSVLGEHTPLSGLAEDGLPSPTVRAARAAYEAAGIGPEDLDVVELQDTDSGRELLSYEELLLCRPGEAGRLIAERRTEMGGALPVNPSGGLLSKGEPVGASSLGQVVELCWQLQGRAGPRQVPNARVALSHTVGRGANASVIVLTR